MSALGGASILDFVQRYKEYEAHRDNTHEFIKDLLIYSERVESTLREENSLLLQKLKDTQLDLDDSIRTRRELQQRLRDSEERLREANTRAAFVSQNNDHLKNTNPYILALIDGNGLIFKEEFIKQGLEGGRRAAATLRQAVANCYIGSGKTEMIASVFANLSGLSEALKRDGSIDGEVELRNFMLGFNQAKASFDFVDVSYNADSKIKELTKFHLRNHDCEHVILGISHDAGYAQFLYELMRENRTRTRVSVFEGYPTVREIASTGVPITNLEGLFRSQKPIDRLPPPNPSPFPSPFPPISATPTKSYATITQRASPPPQITLPLAPKSTNTPVRVPKPQPPAWNPGPRGLDPPIPLNQTALDNIKKRKDSSKLCNNHYLRGPCAKGDECCFEHDYTPNKDEKNAIAFLARLNPCTNGQDCEVDNCIYGHHCPSVINGVCTHPFCKFRAVEHPPGTKFKSPKS
ncbi:hypothetical protein GGR56DRAFT_614239 [Xylariaceae sp. FL0804]|nr:hypothetical protein GGR56DRAFT_614239 [Xylariaceae sp. FL0804]